MSVFYNAYDSNPRFQNAVVRTWTHHYGGPEGFAIFATVWDATRQRFSDVCVNSGDSLWGGEVFEDADAKVMALWKLLSEEERAPRAPAKQPFR